MFNFVLSVCIFAVAIFATVMLEEAEVEDAPAGIWKPPVIKVHMPVTLKF